MKEKLKSRKLFVAVALIALSLVSALAGLVPWVTAIETAAKVGMFYLGAQGLPDAAKALIPIMETLVEPPGKK